MPKIGRLECGSRLSPQNPSSYRDEHLFVDLRYELVMLDNQVLPLTRKEYCLLLLLVQHAGEVVPRKTLLMQVWGNVPEMRTCQVNAHIQRLRKKLGIYGDQHIETVPGVGYRFRPSLPSSQGSKSIFTV